MCQFVVNPTAILPPNSLEIENSDLNSLGLLLVRSTGEKMDIFSENMETKDGGIVLDLYIWHYDYEIEENEPWGMFGHCHMKTVA